MTTMTSRLSFDHTPKMLASRRSGTTEIALFWSKRKHRAAVAVDDQATGEHFELEVNPDDDPLDLYNHPYPYAASRHLITNTRAA
jgi:hypothetical protein